MSWGPSFPVFSRRRRNNRGTCPERKGSFVHVCLSTLACRQTEANNTAFQLWLKHTELPSQVPPFRALAIYCCSCNSGSLLSLCRLSLASSLQRVTVPSEPTVASLSQNSRLLRTLPFTGAGGSGEGPSPVLFSKHTVCLDCSPCVSLAILMVQTPAPHSGKWSLPCALLV